jgi:transcriptional activator of cad operon
VDELGERLESWKKIAAYLKRDVRTVQRWEQSNGLPIHRHQRAQRALPYAYIKELDAWWARQSESPDLLVAAEPPRVRATRKWVLIGAAAMLVVVGGMVAAFRLLANPAAGVSPKSVAVLPFVDLSEDMANEEFADGVTEELIDRLGKIEGMRVPAPTSTFYYKNKQVPVQEIAGALAVAYVLDGSVRKSGGRVRVAARLIRAGDGTVVWSESYDRPWSDLLAVQDEIANAVTKAVRTSIG